jgi:hypothetical protein
MTILGPGQPQLRTARTAKLERGTPARQHPTGRRCAARQCGTVLSRYNPSDTCARHAGWQDPDH